MSAMNTEDLVQHLTGLAMELNEPGEVNYEYARGQAELIIDACGLHMDEARDTLILVITHQLCGHAVLAGRN